MNEFRGSVSHELNSREDIEARVNSMTFRGFKKETVNLVRGLFLEIGLPIPYGFEVVLYNPLIELGRQKHVAGVRQSSGHDEFFGSYTTEEMLIHEKRFLTLSRDQQKAVLAHETAHVLDLVSQKSSYSSEGKTFPFAEQVAEQCIKSGVFLSRYHEHNAALYLSARGKSNKAKALRTYHMETWAILMHIRYTNPTHLRDVSAQQKALLGADAVSLLSISSTPEGIDKVILARFMQSGATLADLNRMIGSTDGVPVDMPFTKPEDYKRVKKSK